MKIIEIQRFKYVDKTEKEMQKDFENGASIMFGMKKPVLLKEPVYIVEMTRKELQLVSFYLELEKRKPIMNVEIDAELKKEQN